MGIDCLVLFDLEEEERRKEEREMEVRTILGERTMWAGDRSGRVGDCSLVWRERGTRVGRRRGCSASGQFWASVQGSQGEQGGVRTGWDKVPTLYARKGCGV